MYFLVTGRIFPISEKNLKLIIFVHFRGISEKRRQSIIAPNRTIRSKNDNFYIAGDHPRPHTQLPRYSNKRIVPTRKWAAFSPKMH